MKITADEILKFSSSECTKLTPLKISRWHPSACAGFTAACLDKFDTTNLGFECMLNFPVSATYELTLKTSFEILNSDSDKIYMTPVDLNVLLVEYGEQIKKLPLNFLDYISSSPRMSLALLRVLSNLNLNDLLNQFLRVPYIEKIPPYAFRHFQCSSLQEMPLETFKALSDEQFGSISENTLDCLTIDQLKAMKPVHMKFLSATNITLFDNNKINAITVDQALSLGRDLNELPKDANYVDKRSFIDTHPCYTFPESISSVPVKMAIDKRCSPIWSFLKPQPMVLPAKKAQKSGGGIQLNPFQFVVVSLASIYLINL